MKNHTFKPLMFILILWVPAMGSEPGCDCEDVNEVSAAKLQSFYKGDNGSLVYVRQKGSEIYWFTAKVFFGTKSSSGVKIEWIDIPLVNTRCHGKASFKIVGPQNLRVEQQGIRYLVDQEHPGLLGKCL